MKKIFCKTYQIFMLYIVMKIVTININILFGIDFLKAYKIVIIFTVSLIFIRLLKKINKVIKRKRFLKRNQVRITGVAHLNEEKIKEIFDEINVN